MKQEVIDAIAAAGFDVYMRSPKDTFLIYADGPNIGYLQDNRLGGYSISTVHVPNRSTGTGFQIETNVTEFTREVLSRAFVLAPDWARGDVRSVRKYGGIEGFRAADSFNADYKLTAAKR